MSPKLRWLFPAAGFLAAAYLAATAFGQAPAGDKKDPQEKFEPKSGPGAGQKFLAKFVGEWDVVKTFYPRTPDAEPKKSGGTCVQAMTQGGRFLTSEFAFDGPAGKTTGTGVIGFEPATGLFTSTWVDSRQTRMSFRRSAEPFDEKRIVLWGVSLDEPKDPRKSKTVTTLAADPPVILHRQFSVSPDGTERAVMQLEMTRKK